MMAIGRRQQLVPHPAPARDTRRVCAARVAFLGSALLGVLAAGRVEAQTARQDFYITNGTVNAQVLSGNSLYIGGSFTNVGPVVGCGVPLDPSTGVAIAGFPHVTGQINAVISDGSGGWFIGGSFTTVGAASRTNLAHILPDMSVSAWNPGADGQVLSLALNGGTLYAGGAFLNAGGQARSRIAAIDASTGAATSWDPGASDLVRSIAPSGATVYVGGKFATAGGAARSHIAALDASTGAATSWNPGASLEVYAVGVRAGTVYAGGAFTVIGGVTRNRLAAVDSATGGTKSWNPSLNGQVNAFAMGSTSMYVGGLFTTVGASTRLRLAEVPLASNAATSWDPTANGAVLTVHLAGSTVYAGGDFLNVGGQDRSRLAALSTSTGLATAWDPVAYSTVQAIAVSGGNVYAGGAFGGVGGVVRNNLAAIDIITGEPTSWNPNADNQVLALTVHGNTLYVGGVFMQMGGQSRIGIAALDLPSGLTKAWNPSTDGQVSAITVENGVIYIGGNFSTAGGQTRTNLAALDTTTALATSWAPEADGQVFRLLASGGLIYAGGSFAWIGGDQRNNIAAVDPVTGLATAWNPNSNGTIRDIAATCGSIYVGGFFTNIGGMSRNRLAALNPATGVPTSWNANANGPVYCLSLNDGILYAGGVLNIIGGLSRNRLAALDPVSGLATSWSPNANNTVRSIVVGGGALYAGGSFTTMGATLQGNVAALPVDVSITCPVISVTPAGLADGFVSTPYSVTLGASGGTAPYCWSLVEGTLPPGLTLAPESGLISGTPSGASASVFSVRVTDAHGCTADRPYTLDVFAGAITSTVTAVTTGLFVNPAHACVSVPFNYVRTESAPARAVSVTFQIDPSRLALCNPGSPYFSIQMGGWLDDYSNSLLQVVDNGGGSYRVDALILGSPCGQTQGGTLFTADLKSIGPDGPAAVTVTSVHVRDCANSPIGAIPGAPESLTVFNAPLVITPASLPAATEYSLFHQVLATAPGTAPYAYTVTAGALPPGVTLSSAGVLDGTPALSGTFAFTVGVSDVHGSAGSRAYSLPVQCPSIVLRPGALPDGVNSVAYSQTLTASRGHAPFTFTLIDGSLPSGLTLSAAGLLSGTFGATETRTFTVQVADSQGCTANRSYTLSSFGAPITSRIAPITSGLCLGTGHPVVAVPFVFTRTDTTHARAVSVTFQLDPSRVVLRTPAAPESSLVLGSWFAGGTTTSQVTGYGDGSYTVDITILGGPCGPAVGGTLFTMDVVAAAPSGTGTITATATHVRGCDNAPIPVSPGAAGTLLLGITPPAPIADLVASRVASGNGAGATTGIQLTWSNSQSDTVRLYRAPFPTYPAYAGSAPDSALAPAAPWVLIATGVASGYVDHPAGRGFYYYIATRKNECGNLSAVSNRSTGTLDYLLGDVSDGLTPGTGNNVSGMEDISLLGANYGIGTAQIGLRGVGYLDVGPTTNAQLTSRPVPDGLIDFEDLMIFTGNFDTGVTAPAALARRATTLAAAGAAHTAHALEAFHVNAPSAATSGTLITASLTLTATGRMQGFSVQLGWDPSVVEPVGMQSSRFVEGQGGLVLSPGAGCVDAALLGVREQGVDGNGEVARFTFRALRDGNPAITLARIRARDAANQPLAPDALAGTAPPPPPTQTALLAPAPNPFHGSTAVNFSLAHAGPVQLAIYSVDGRRVRLLADGFRDAGVYRLAWDGRDDARGAAAPGVYFARFSAEGRRYSTRLVYLR